MASDGTGTNWNIAVPANTDNQRDGALEIRETKAAVALRVNKEHVPFNTNSLGGEHVAGSAQAWYQSTTPTATPGGTVLDATHAGRIWFDTNGATGSFFGALAVWTGTVFVLPSITASSQFQAGVVGSLAIGMNVITTTNMANGSVQMTNISNGSVGSLQLQSNAVTGTNVLAGAIGAAALANNAVVTIALADSNVTTGKLADGAVTSVKLASNAVTGTNVIAGGISTSNIANGSITPEKLAAGLKLATGAYVGTGVNPGPIVAVGFQPKFLFIGDTTSGQVVWTVDPAPGGTAVIGGGGIGRVDGGNNNGTSVTITSTGFSVITTNAQVNAVSRSYSWVAYG